MSTLKYLSSTCQTTKAENIILGIWGVTYNVVSNATLPNSEEIDIEGMEKEIIALGIKEASELVNYVLHQRSSEKQYDNGIRDRG